VREINDPAELAPLRSAWDELLRRTPGASFQQSLPWLATYWKHFGAGKRLRVLVVEDGDEVVGILPLAVFAAQPYEPASLMYPMDYWGNFFGPIGPDAGATLAAGMAHLQQTPRDWHFLELSWVDGLLDQGATPAALAAAGMRSVCDRTDASAIVDLTSYASWQEYCASHNSKWRNTLGRQEKKLAKRGKVGYVRHRAIGEEANHPRWDLYEACEAISTASWQGSAGGGTMLNKPEHSGFFRECYEQGTPEGGIDLDVLFVDERPAAFCYSFVYRGRVSEAKVAYHPDFAHEGAGTVLQARQLAESFARGDHTIELGHEFMYWKEVWMTHLRPVHRYVHFPLGVGAQATRLKRAFKRRLRATLGRWRQQRKRSPVRVPQAAEQQA
jgi:CelD/BcsL family acetyltransferase involved in cellulose biosynthesis